MSDSENAPSEFGGSECDEGDDLANSDEEEEFQPLQNPDATDPDDASDLDVADEEVANSNQKSQVRKRAKKFTWAEKLLLTELVGQVAEIIENVESNNNVNTEKKNKAWKVIAGHYPMFASAQGITVQRTEAQLRKCWERIKAQCRKEDSDNKNKQLLEKTGNLPIKKTKKMTDKEILFNQIRLVVPTLDLTLNNPYDSTGQVEALQNPTFQAQALEDCFIVDDDILAPTAPCDQSDRPGSSGETGSAFKCESNFVVEKQPMTESRAIDTDEANQVPKRVNIKSSIETGPVEEQQNLVKLRVQKVLKQKGVANKKNQETKTVDPSKRKIYPSSRSPLQNLSNLKRKASPSPIVPDILGNRLNSIPDLKTYSGKKKKTTNEVQIEFETRTRKQDEGISQQAEIHRIRRGAVEQELKYWTNMALASEKEVQIKESELHAKAYSVRAERLKFQYWTLKKSTEFGPEESEDE